MFAEEHINCRCILVVNVYFQGQLTLQARSDDKSPLSAYPYCIGKKQSIAGIDVSDIMITLITIHIFSTEIVRSIIIHSPHEKLSQCKYSFEKSLQITLSGARFSQ